MDENYYYDDYDETGAEEPIMPTRPVRKFGPTKKGVSPSDILSSMRLAMVNGRLVMVSTNPDLADEKGNWNVNPYTGNAIQAAPPQSPYWGGNAPQMRGGSGGGRYAQQQPQPQPYYGQPQQWAGAQPPSMPLTAEQKKQIFLQQHRQRQDAIRNAKETKSTRMNFVGAAPGGPSVGVAPPAAIRQRQPAPHMGRFMFKS